MSWGLYALTLLAVVGAGVRGAWAVSLAWDPSPSEGVVGYEVHIGHAPGEYDHVIDVGPRVTWIVNSLTESRTYYFAVSAYDARGARSELSNVIVHRSEKTDALPPTSRLLVEPRSGPAPHSILVSLETSASVPSYRWDFGDGSTFVTNMLGPLAKLAHTYAEPGAYALRFTASGASQTVLSLRAGHIVVTPPEGCPCSLFGSAVPQVANGDPAGPVTVGIRFKVLATGEVTGLRFYRSAESKAAGVGALWSSDGRELGRALFPPGGGEGWQAAPMESPVAVVEDQVLVASYHAADGRHAQDDGALLRGFVNGPLQILPYLTGAGNGLVAHGPSLAFPDQEARASHFGVDVLFTLQQPRGRSSDRHRGHAVVR